jgi:hypothetical protein
MAQYVVRKLRFFYAYGSYSLTNYIGTVITITGSPEQAQAIKQAEDIKSLKSLQGSWIDVWVYLNPNPDRICKKLEAFYRSEYNTAIGNLSDLYFPKEITNELAATYLSVLELSFHDIIEYPDNEVITVDDEDYTAGGEEF